jgi:predicted kinase
MQERRKIQVLLLTGTCGSGKTTIAGLLGRRPGWTCLSEDDVWRGRFGLDRGAFGSPEYAWKRRQVHEAVFRELRCAFAAGQRVAIDVTLHEAPPEGYRAYAAFLDRQRVPWALRVLHPSLAVAVARDAARSHRPIGQARIATLRAKFTGQVFPSEWFLDTSKDTPEETVLRLETMGLV